MKTKLCIIYNDLNKPVIVVDIFDNWPDANSIAQMLNSHIRYRDWYFKAIGTKYDDLQES